MDRPAREFQETTQDRPHYGIGTPLALLLMLALCAPLVGYAFWLLERHGPAVSLAGLSPLELLGAAGLLVLPFAALRLLGVRWNPDR